jgi:hypothetical protein
MYMYVSVCVCVHIYIHIYIYIYIVCVDYNTKHSHTNISNVVRLHKTQKSRICRGKARVLPIPVVARSQVWVCNSTLFGSAGSNPAGSMDVCLLWVLCVVSKWSLRRADPLSREYYRQRERGRVSWSGARVALLPFNESVEEFKFKRKRVSFIM